MLRRATLAVVLLLAVAAHAAEPGQDAPAPPPATSAPAEAVNNLFKATTEERDAIERLRHADSWVRRAIAAERLARYDDEGSATYLRDLAADGTWQVRCYAILACGRRGIDLPASRFASEREPRVLRTALRCRYEVPESSLRPLVERAAKSERLEDKLLALELALASTLPEDVVDRDDLLETIIFRMDRTETGSLSPRLAAITSGHDYGRSYRWREWFRKNRKDAGLNGAFVLPARGTVSELPWPASRGLLAALAPPRFADLERHIQDLSTREIDLAILIDCTASMSGEIAECQSGVDALMLFAQSVARDVRIAVIGYRDRRDKWETKAFDFTPSLSEARERLWQLSAEGGGDRPESVEPALKLAYTKLAWRPGKSLNAILIGDAPPHPGTGERCVELAAWGKKNGVTTYAIAPHVEQQQRKPTDPLPIDPEKPGTPEEPPAPDPEMEKWNRPGPAPLDSSRKRKAGDPWRKKLEPGEVEYFEEIATAGGGRAVKLPRDASLVAEIAGLTMGDRFKDEFEGFFWSWMLLCR